MPAEILVETHELAEKKRGQQKGHGESRRINGQEQHAARDRVAGSGEHEHGGKDRTDAGRPAKGKSEAKKEATQDAGLRIGVVKAHVLIQPASQMRPKETNDGEREKWTAPRPRKSGPP